MPNQSGRDLPFVFPARRELIWNFYIQDKWQVNSKLTVDVGIRLERERGSKPRLPGGYSNYNPANNTLELSGLGSVPNPDAIWVVDLLSWRYGNPARLMADAVVDAWIDAEAYALYTLSDVTGVVEGRSGGARSSYNKIFWSELDVRLHQVALDLLGPDAELDGSWMKGFQFALSGPIYAGTNEIQRNIVAERVLGLPRK